MSLSSGSVKVSVVADGSALGRQESKLTSMSVLKKRGILPIWLCGGNEGHQGAKIQISEEFDLILDRDLV
jgi:hypothetical protein